jgi:hypothetical protein
VIRARDLLLHPIAIAAIGILVANDHWWKLSHPGWWTGKASDVAGMAFFPLLVLVVVERAVTHRTLALALAAGATAIAFALVKTVPAASAVFGHALGLLQWPGAAVAAWWHGNPLTGPIAASVVTDPTDLLAIPFVAVAVIVARRCGYLAEPTRDLVVRVAGTGCQRSVASSARIQPRKSSRLGRKRRTIAV